MARNNHNHVLFVLMTGAPTYKLAALGGAIRARVAADSIDCPKDAMLFVNLHPAELDDPSLFDQDAPLSKMSNRVVGEGR